MRRHLVALLAAGLLAGCGEAPVSVPVAGITVPAAGAASPSPSAATPSPTRAAPRAVEDAGSELEVEDQSGDGRVLVVAEASLSRGPGWVVVRSASGRILAAAPVRQGTRLLRVVLDEPAPDGSLLVELRNDDGDGRFEPDRDPVVTEDGEPQSESVRYVLE